MPPLSLLVWVLICSASLFAQDVKVRQEAVQLLERATAASRPANLPNLERVDTFHVLYADGTTGDGSFSRDVVQGTGRRDQMNLGPYHLMNVYTLGHVAVAGASKFIPRE